MDLADRLLEQDQWVTQGLLDRAATLQDAELDRTFSQQPGGPNRRRRIRANPGHRAN